MTYQVVQFSITAQPISNLRLDRQGHTGRAERASEPNADLRIGSYRSGQDQVDLVESAEVRRDAGIGDGAGVDGDTVEGNREAYDLRQGGSRFGDQAVHN